jgi:hypothetical protein
MPSSDGLNRFVESDSGIAHLKLGNRLTNGAEVLFGPCQGLESIA